MKRNHALTSLFAALTALLLTASFAVAQPKGKTVIAAGELIDMWCYFEGGDHGAGHKACSTACAKAGNPIGLLQKSGAQGNHA